MSTSNESTQKEEIDSSADMVQDDMNDESSDHEPDFVLSMQTVSGPSRGNEWVLLPVIFTHNDCLPEALNLTPVDLPPSPVNH